MKSKSSNILIDSQSDGITDGSVVNFRKYHVNELNEIKWLQILLNTFRSSFAIEESSVVSGWQCMKISRDGPGKKTILLLQSP